MKVYTIILLNSELIILRTDFQKIIDYTQDLQSHS
jgi:hypothetical protein